MNRIMIDLETMGLGNAAPIIAIGAVLFNEVDGIIDKFYVTISLQSAMAISMQPDADTIMWWMKQSEEARKEFTEGTNTDIKDALQQFTNWVAKIRNSDNSNYNVEVWGNGASFDNVVLRSAYQLANMPAPWKFWEDRCYRTVRALNNNVAFTRVGVFHNALNDAESQAQHLISILNGDEKK